MTLQQLRVLVFVLEHGSFSAAALELGISQSSVSYMIAELETELGVRLTSRGRFGAAATAAGERIAGHARRMLDLAEAIRQEASLDQGRIQGVLRVGTFRSAAARVMPEVVAELRSSYPELSVTILESPGTLLSADALLEGGRVDVAFAQREMTEEAVFWELLRDPYQAVLPAGGWQGVRKVSLAALAREPMVLAGSQNACARPVLEALGAIDPTFRPAYEIGEDSTILSMVAQGLGVSIMPALAIDNVPAGVRLAELEEPIDRGIGVALLPSALKVPAVRAFLTALRRRFPESGIPAFPDLPSGRQGQPEAVSSHRP